mmetsp:Transcript_101297/g.158243  ORF Transcript_101297/g.158243 Transcript_101297/m.158243 type:complete len:231 (+) Transcript_101297:92-784(+)|eukprot:CAMPEP_0169248526 /NCGR_PEP_ID=MMETSP1016-20121227/35892_1 /TAXON_ID=342587 /ORGANISM="Karlodinium micrum, Strain CCMP2283" /LENGTH=230 /DNA_ID=CAMNT_0009329333 /DNA_START=99 /DNA_END=791 /DNA_ORIENTATION=+
MRYLIVCVVFQIACSGRVSSALTAFIIDANSTDGLFQEVHLGMANLSVIRQHGFSLDSSLSNSTRVQGETVSNTNLTSRSKAADTEEDGHGTHLNSSRQNRSSSNSSVEKANFMSFILAPVKDSRLSVVPVLVAVFVAVLCLFISCTMCVGGKQKRKKGFMANLGRGVQGRRGSSDTDGISNSSDDGARKHKGLLAKGKESRGVEADAKYKFGDLSRGVIQSAKKGMRRG